MLVVFKLSTYQFFKPFYSVKLYQKVVKVVRI